MKDKKDYNILETDSDNFVYLYSDCGVHQIMVFITLLLCSVYYCALYMYIVIVVVVATSVFIK